MMYHQTPRSLYTYAEDVVNEWDNFSYNGSSNLGSNNLGKRQQGRRSEGRSSLESVQYQEESKDPLLGRNSNETINELQNEIKVLKESNELLKERIGQLEELLKAKEELLSHIVEENNKYKIVKDFKEVFEKSWKESCEKEIKNLKTELELMSAKLKRSDIENSVIKCDKCVLSFKTVGLLRRHVRFHHSDEAEVNIKKESEKGRGCDTIGSTQ